MDKQMTLDALRAWHVEQAGENRKHEQYCTMRLADSPHMPIANRQALKAARENFKQNAELHSSAVVVLLEAVKNEQI